MHGDEAVWEVQVTKVEEDTIRYFAPKWIRNMISFADTKIPDVSELSLEGKKRIVILGTGLSALKYERRREDFIVGNQTTLLVEERMLPDACIVTDAGDPVLDKLLQVPMYKKRATKFILADSVDERVVKNLAGRASMYGFHHSLSLGLTGDIIDAFKPERIQTVVTQVGSSMNAAFLLFSKMMLQRKERGEEMLPIYLAGVDYKNPPKGQEEQYKIYEETLEWLIKNAEGFGISLYREKV